MENFLRVGVIANTHGIKGEVKVFPTTEDMSRFQSLKFILLDTGKEKKELEIQSVRYFKQMVLLKFKGIDSINDIEKYKGKDLLIPREEAIPLEEDEYFLCDILGAKVITQEGKQIGRIEEILKTGANDVYVVKNSDGKEILLPVIPECVLEIRPEEKQVMVHLMKGLMEEE